MKYTIILLTALLASPAAALTCVDPATANEGLKQDGYQPVFWGDTPTGENLTVWVKDGGWIATILTADGRVCIGGMGDDWGVNAVGDPA